jgi:hypothetical protein
MNPAYKREGPSVPYSATWQQKVPLASIAGATMKSLESDLAVLPGHDSCVGLEIPQQRWQRLLQAGKLVNAAQYFNVLVRISEDGRTTIVPAVVLAACIMVLRRRPDWVLRFSSAMIIGVPFIMVPVPVIVRHFLFNGSSIASSAAFGSTPASHTIFAIAFLLDMVFGLTFAAHAWQQSCYYHDRWRSLVILRALLDPNTTEYCAELAWAEQLGTTTISLGGGNDVNNTSRSSTVRPLCSLTEQDGANLQGYITVRRLLRLLLFPAIENNSIQSLASVLILSAYLIATIVLLAINAPPYNDPSLQTYLGVLAIISAVVVGGSLVSRTYFAALSNQCSQQDLEMLADIEFNKAFQAGTPSCNSGLFQQRLTAARHALAADSHRYVDKIALVPASFSILLRVALALATIISLSLRLLSA